MNINVLPFFAIPLGQTLRGGNPSIIMVNLIMEVENNQVLTLHYMNQILNELTLLQKFEIIEH
ncbi:hypothetical protein [Chengkuizengella sediminis]|uniref:hypothetical protein n=1 Tax=Chengkuizengella sediminis TaxID=1885917 RepID=UPI00138996B5|nr:hypothetical protein [Chengkuizengella sediminis]